MNPLDLSALLQGLSNIAQLLSELLKIRNDQKTTSIIEQIKSEQQKLFDGLIKAQTDAIAYLSRIESKLDHVSSDTHQIQQWNESEMDQKLLAVQNSYAETIKKLEQQISDAKNQRDGPKLCLTLHRPAICA
jgi:hypothetical protein